MSARSRGGAPAAVAAARARRRVRSPPSRRSGSGSPPAARRGVVPRRPRRCSRGRARARCPTAPSRTPGPSPPRRSSAPPPRGGGERPHRGRTTAALLASWCGCAACTSRGGGRAVLVGGFETGRALDEGFGGRRGRGGASSHRRRTFGRSQRLRLVVPLAHRLVAKLLAQRAWPSCSRVVSRVIRSEAVVARATKLASRSAS